MRLVRFRTGSGVSFGVATAGGIVDVGRRLGAGLGDVREVLEAGALAVVEEAAAGLSADHGLDGVEYLLPVNRPDKILCVGVNYAHRADEYRDDRAPSEKPNLFLRTLGSFVGHRAALVRPLVSRQLDYEGEIALVIGKAGRGIAQEDAAGHVAGLTIANEGTVRDWLKHGNRQNTPGKNFDCSGSIGPWIDTGAPRGVGDRISVKTWVNQEQRQDDHTGNLTYTFDYLVHYISQWTMLYPGDMILTGTPVGAGVRFDPPRFLAPGDVLRVEVGGVGVLENPVVDEGARD